MTLLLACGADPTHPDAAEIAGDGVDQDCDELQACFENLDGDGVGSEIVVEAASCGRERALATGDCDDAGGGDRPRRAGRARRRHRPGL